MSETLKKVITFAVIVLITISALLILMKEGRKHRSERISAVEKGNKHSRGIIKKIFHYKSQTLTIAYRINNVDYQYEGGWDNNPNHLDVGDSIEFKYALSDPKIIVVELENEY